MFMSQTKVSFDVPSSIVFERKFDTAIRGSQITEFKKRIENSVLTFDDKLIVESKIYKKYDEFKSNPSLYARILSKILHTPSYSSKNKFKSYSRISHLVHTNLNIQVGHLFQSLSPSLKQKFSPFFKNNEGYDNIPGIVTTLLDVSYRLSLIIEKTHAISQYLPIRNNELRLEKMLMHNTTDDLSIFKINMVWSFNLIGITLEENLYILPKPYLLMIHNKLCDLTSVLLLAHYGSGNVYPANTFDIVMEFVKEMIYLARSYEINFFGISKCIESLVTAETLIKVEEWANDEFLHAITRDLEADTTYQYQNSPLQFLFRSQDPPMLHELGCLSKLFGHPLVDMEEGARQINKKATQAYDVSYVRIKEVECYVKDSYIRNHIMNKGLWPPVQINNPSLAPVALIQAHLRNLDYSDPGHIRKYGKIEISDLTYIDILPNMHFSKLENCIPYLKDKTISMMRSQVISKYLEMNHDVKQSWTNTRLLLHFLLNPSSITNHVEYINRYTSVDSLSELSDYLVCRIVPKEKEHKVKFRGFGCKTAEDRMRCLAQEKAAMSYLDEFCDEQAMTLSELQLLRKLDAFRRLKLAYKGYHVLYVNLDASSWCNHFRKETVDDIMINTMDKVFDTRIFSRTHEAYENTLYYVPDGPTTYSWDGQSGGIEGLNQDTWVVTYIAQIKTALSHINMKYLILCKGDDFRLVLLIPENDIPSSEIRKTKNIIIDKISKIANELGHEIKVIDSYGSERYFNFSKNASINLIELSQGFRKIQKAYGANNAFLPTLDEYIASTFSNAHSATKTMSIVVPNYSVALYWSYFYLLSHAEYSKLSDSELIGLLLVPNLTGGFPIIYLHNTFVRAESDLLSPFLSLLVFCKKYYIEVYKSMTRFCVAKCPPHESFDQLYIDNYSLPVSKPPLPSSVLKGMIAPALETLVKNEDIKDLFEATRSPTNAIVLQIMNSCNYFNAKILSSIYAALPHSILREILTKFESSRSVHELLIMRLGKRKTNQQLRKIVKAERTLQRWRLQKYDASYFEEDISYLRFITDCPAESAFNIRAHFWGKPVVGITVPPLQHLIHITPPLEIINSGWAIENHFEITITPPVEILGKPPRMQFSSGSNKPFLGSNTTKNETSPTIHLVEKDFLLRKLRDLCTVATWSDCSEWNSQGELITSNVRDLISKLIKMYTSQPLEKLAPFSGAKLGGTIQHHLRTHNYRAGIIPNVNSNLYQSASYNSNTHMTMKHSAHHYNINMLHVLCHAIQLLNFELEYSHTRTTEDKYWIVTSNCTYCSTPINEKPMFFQSTNFGSIYYNPLSLTSIDRHMVKVLRESLALNPNEYMKKIDQRHIPYDVALLGIMSEIWNCDRKLTQSLQTRYTNTVLSHQAKEIVSSLNPRAKTSKISRYTFARLNPEMLTPILCSFIVFYASKLLNRIDVRDIYITLRPIAVSSIPWYELTYLLFESNQIPAIMSYLHNRCDYPSTMTYHSPNEVVYQLGALAIEYYLMNPTSIPFLVISNYAVSFCLPQLKTGLQSLIWTSIHRDIDGLTNQEIDCIHAKNLGLLLIDVDNDSCYKVTTVEEGRQVMPLRKLYESEMEFLDYSIVTDEEELLDHSTYLFHQYRYIYNIRLSRTLSLFEQYYEEMYKHVLEFLNQEITIWHVSISECMTLLPYLEKVSSESLAPPLKVINDPIYLVNNLDLRSLKEGRLIRIKPSNSYQEIDFYQSIDPPIHHVYLELDTTAYYNHFGYANTSQTSLSYIFDIIGINLQNMKHLYVSVLGDGIGEVTNLITVICTDSHILFNTLNDTVAGETKPIAAISNNKTNTLYFEHLGLGLDDLSRIETLVYYEKIFPSNDMIILEAETFPTLGVRNFSLYQNVIRYCQNTLTDQGILILKQNLWDPFTTCLVVQAMSESFMSINFIKPPNQHNTHILYLVAVRKIRPIRPLENVKVSLTVTTIIKDYLTNLAEHDYKETLNVPLRLKYKPCGRRFWKKKLTCYWANKLYKNCSIYLNKEDIKEIGMIMREHGTSEVTSKIFHIINIKHYIRILEGQLENHSSTTSLGADMNTQHNRIFSFNQLLYLQGFIFMTKNLFSTTLTMRSIRCEYLSYLRASSVRDYNPTVKYSSLFHYHMYGQNNEVLNYWQSWLGGMRCSLSMRGYSEI